MITPKTDIVRIRAENYAEIDRLCIRKQSELVTRCARDGGHTFTEWERVLENPIFGSVCMEERHCTSCHHTEQRDCTQLTFSNRAFEYFDFDNAIPIPPGRGADIDISVVDDTGEV